MKLQRMLGAEVNQTNYKQSSGEGEGKRERKVMMYKVGKVRALV